MSLAIHRAEFFITDFEREFARYVEVAGVEVAWRFQTSLDVAVFKLSNQPDLGQVRHFRNPNLREMRSFRVERPFHKLMIFYRVEPGVLKVVRLMHGARDLPRRLVEPPETASQ
jgi:plasmid stabilization system protein ParE